MILGKIVGKASTLQFQFSVTSSAARKLQFLQVYHPEYGAVLGQIMELERTEEGMTAHCNIIGYKDEDGRVKSIRTPFAIGVEVLEAEDAFIKEVITLQGEGGFLGKLEGKDIPVFVDLQKILTKHLCVLAKSGAGKSYAVGGLLEEIMEKRVPLLVIDPHGEYASMKWPTDEDHEMLQRWKITPRGYGTQIQEYGDMSVKEDVRPLKLDEKMTSYELMKVLPLQLTNTQEAILFSVIKDLEDVTFDTILLGLEQLNSSSKWAIIEMILHLRNMGLFAANYTPLNELVAPGKCTIINLKGMLPEIQDLIVYKLLKDLFMARKQEKIPPFFCVIEEAHNFCPEKGFGKAKSTDVIRLISSEGRKFGMGLCVVSQRPALVQKSVLAQCTTQLIMKVTNPNDLKAVTGSIEGITTETENEIQNLPVGSALLCGMVDRPLVVTIRPRRSKHGGRAVNMIGAVQEEYTKNVVLETREFEEQGLLSVIKPKLELKEIMLMSTAPIKKITTYLIPAAFFRCDIKGYSVDVLLDRIKGMIILDPDNDQKREIRNLGVDCAFFRKPAYEKIDFDVKLDAKITLNQLKTELGKYCKVEDMRECFIVYRKVEW